MLAKSRGVVKVYPANKNYINTAQGPAESKDRVFSRQTTLAAGLLVSIALSASRAGAAPAEAIPCVVEPAKVLLDQRVSLAGDGMVRLPLPASPAALLQVAEEGIDVAIKVDDAAGGTVAEADNPIARQGIQHAELPARSAEATLVIRGKEHARLTGQVRVLLSVPTRARTPNDCLRFVRLMAQGDAAYAVAVRQLSAVANSQEKTTNNDFSRALEEYRRIGIALGDQAELAGWRGFIELSTAAVYYFHLSDWKESAAWAKRAMESFSGAHDEYMRARAESLRNAAWIEMPNVDSRYDNARSSFSRLAAFHRARSEAYDETLQTNNIGLAYYNEARFDEAIKYYATARDSFERLGETPRFALAIQNIALCDWGQGRWQSAANSFARALRLMRPEPYLDLYLLTLNNSAMAHLAAGKFGDALIQHNRAHELAGRACMTLEIARSFYGLGATYYAIGDTSLAQEFLFRALSFVEPGTVVCNGRDINRVPDRRVRLASLRALATIEQETGAFDKADGYYREALTLATAPNVKARIQLRQALGDLARKKYQTALDVATRVAKGDPNVNSLTQALAGVIRAKVLRSQGDLDSATTELSAAISIFVKYQALSDEFDARVELARVHREAGRRDAALEELLKAIDSTEELRAQTANPEHRASVANDIRPALDLALTLYREQYDERSAAGSLIDSTSLARKSLELADYSRAQSLHQLRMQRQDAWGNPQLASLAQERAMLLRDLADRRYYLAVREERALTDEVAQALRADIARLRASLGGVENSIAKIAAGTGNRTQVKRDLPLPLPRGSAVIEYWLGSTAAYAWVVSGRTVNWIRLGDPGGIGVTARDLQTALASYYRSPLTSGARASVEARAQALYRMMVQPLGTALSDVESLTVVPDGVVHFVPFAMLRGSAQDTYLVQRVAIRHTPALWLNSSKPRTQPKGGTGRMLLVSDPIYQPNDDRLGPRSIPAVATSAGHGPRLRETVDPAHLERLIGSTGEAAGIRALFGGSEIDELTGLDAVRARVLDRDLQSYRFVHIAAHGNIDSEIPSLSSLVLGAFDRNGRVDDQQIRVGDLLDKSFSADVVALSACNTSVGHSYALEGPIGLHYAVLARGATAVVASLWAVADETNAELMTELYRRMITQTERVDFALAGAMRTQIAAHPERDPVFWAPYNTYAID